MLRALNDMLRSRSLLFSSDARTFVERADGKKAEVVADITCSNGTTYATAKESATESAMKSAKF
jgi:hypothetical protein